MVPTNYLAVLVCGIVAMGLGWLWYGPLFGKQWMAIMGWTPEKMAAMQSDPKMKATMMRSYGLMFVGALVMAWVLSRATVFTGSYMQLSGVAAGLHAGFLSWLGFVAPATLGGVLWEQKPWKWWMLLNGYYVVALVVMGVILGAWM